MKSEPEDQRTIKMTLQEYLHALSGKRIAVVGLGVSNLPLLRLLLNAGIDVTVCEVKTAEALGDLYREMSDRGVKWSLGPGNMDDLNFDVVFRTPGLHPDVLRPGLGADTIVTSEMEAFFQVCPCTIIAVTGSAGKTTTTTIISEILKIAGKKVWLGGNIGTPLLEYAPEMTQDDICVLELSSFQLMTMHNSPEIAVITNVMPDHLDYHKDMAEYVSAKRNIFDCGVGSRCVVLNADNEVTRSCIPSVKGECRLFTMAKKPEYGAFFDGEWLLLQNDTGTIPVVRAADIKIPGLHNVENYLAAFSAVWDYAPIAAMEKVAREFSGVDHRLQLIRTLRNVQYYNDSIATSPSRTIAGLRSFSDKVILIAGGRDKRVPFDNLAREILLHVKALFLVGETAEKIESTVRAVPGWNPETLPVTILEDFHEAVVAASAFAKEGDKVLLSPAGASFDQFQNYMERGNRFREIVEGLD